MQQQSKNGDVSLRFALSRRKEKQLFPVHNLEWKRDSWRLTFWNVTLTTIPIVLARKGCLEPEKTKRSIALSKCDFIFLYVKRPHPITNCIRMHMEWKQNSQRKQCDGVWTRRKRTETSPFYCYYMYLLVDANIRFDNEILMLSCAIVMNANIFISRECRM